MTTFLLGLFCGVCLGISAMAAGGAIGLLLSMHRKSADEAGLGQWIP